MKPLVWQIFEEAKANKRPLRSTIIKAFADGIVPDEYDDLTVDEFFATRLKVKNKAGKTVPFVLNRAQFDFISNMTGRDIVVKARQLGFSTAIQGTLYDAVVRSRGQSCVTIAQEGENTAHLVDIFDHFHANMPPSEIPPRRGGYPHGIRFMTTDGKVYIGTAGNRTWGRGKTVHKVHASEVAFWPDAKTTMDGLMESIPPPTETEDTMAVLESTANGAGGFFYEEVQKALRGDTDWRVHFYPWWWAPEYRVPLEPDESIQYTTEEEQLVARVAKEGFILTREQIKWRRAKIADRQAEFHQEYPESITTAFLLSGRPRFEQMRLTERLNTQCQDPVYRDYPTVSHGNVYYQMRIYKRVVGGRRYVIGADTAEGLEITATRESDFSAGIVRDRLSNEQVATLHGRFGPFEFAFLLQELGAYYNGALLGIERNNHGHAVLGYLHHGTADGTIHPYPNLYIHWEDEKLGWPTTPRTRPIMIEDLALEYASPSSYTIYDERIVNEAMAFVVNSKGKAEATAGAFDDLVLADAIAGEMRVAPVEEKEVVYKPVKIGDFD